MPPPDDGNEYLPFAELIRLKKIDDLTYQSIALPFCPGGALPGSAKRSYGGHVYAQAAWAACHTVRDGLQLYNVVGTFLLPGQKTVPFVYHVHKIRDGRSFSTRIVHVTQGDPSAIAFTGIMSFKAPEKSLLDVQEHIDIWEEYKVALHGRTPPDFPDVHGMDVPFYTKLRRETGYNDKFPGLDQTKVDLTSYNQHRHPLDRRSLMFYRATGELPADPNMHLCAHLYASDRNSLYIVANNMDVGGTWKQMSSLVHSTSFHGNTEDLMFGPSKSNMTPMDDTVQGRWFAKEAWTTHSSNGRALYHGRFSASNGTQVATATQDGLIRYSKKADATDSELNDVREKQRRWPSREKL